MSDKHDYKLAEQINIPFPEIKKEKPASIITSHLVGNEYLLINHIEASNTIAITYSDKLNKWIIHEAKQNLEQERKILNSEF